VEGRAASRNPAGAFFAGGFLADPNSPNANLFETMRAFRMTHHAQLEQRTARVKSARRGVRR
jgi:hypothetical protein